MLCIAPSGRFLSAMLMVLASEHGESGSGSGSTETSLGQMHRLVVLTVLELQQLVGCKGRRCHPNHKVDAFSKVDVPRNAWEPAPRQLGGR